MRKLLLLTIVGLLLVACAREGSDGNTDDNSNGVTATPDATRTAVASAGEAVSFPTSRDLTLQGTLYGSGGPAVIFAHEPNSDRSAWQPLAVELASRGFAALVFDMRGHGESEGTPLLSLFRDDIEAAIDFVEGRGLTDYVLVGGDYAGMETIHVAAGRDPAAVVLVSVPESVAYVALERSLRDADLAALEAPKLLIVARDDRIVVTDESTGNTYQGPDYFREMNNIRDKLSEPLEFVTLDGDGHGSRLLETEQRDALIEAVTEFLETHAPPQ
ncbi:MAG: alpha/beta fold hydrolase [Candidatus Promineifilaceae bacterium]|nr:alpha/beta fold hydrolase [Candidatus Promineifilaceae bacterium]